MGSYGVSIINVMEMNDHICEVSFHHIKLQYNAVLYTAWKSQMLEHRSGFETYKRYPHNSLEIVDKL